MTDRYVLLGNPVEHSISPRIFTLFAEQTGQNITYEKLLVPTKQFADTVVALIRDGVHGANVTLPFKLEAVVVADTVTPRAKVAHAANTLIFQNDQTILADNTDGAGLILDLARLGLPVADLKLMIIGAGGACRGIIGPLLSADVKMIYIANRTLSRAQQVVHSFAGDQRVQICASEQFADCDFDCIINTSSASVDHQLPSFIPTELKKPVRWGYDLFYSKQPTVFVKWLKQQGIEQAYDGTGMLVGQAAESFFLWRGMRPQIEPVINQLKRFTDTDS